MIGSKLLIYIFSTKAWRLLLSQEICSHAKFERILMNEVYRYMNESKLHIKHSKSDLKVEKHWIFIKYIQCLLIRNVRQWEQINQPG